MCLHWRIYRPKLLDSGDAIVDKQPDADANVVTHPLPFVTICFLADASVAIPFSSTIYHPSSQYVGNVDSNIDADGTRFILDGNQG